MRKKGFTLIELMVVIAIIGLLSAVLVPSITNLTDKAKAAKIVAAVDVLATGCEAYYMDTGATAWEYAKEWYPQETNHRLSYNPDIAGWNGPYIKAPLSRVDNPGDNAVWRYARTNGWESAAGGQGYDLNGDGTIDTTNAVSGNNIVFYNINTAIAQIAERLIDGSTISYTTGKAEYQGNYYFSVYLRGGR